MSFAFFKEMIECPECGFHTHGLWHDTSMDDARGKILMCEACWENSEEALAEWDI